MEYCPIDRILYSLFERVYPSWLALYSRYNVTHLQEWLDYLAVTLPVVHQQILTRYASIRPELTTYDGCFTSDMHRYHFERLLRLTHQFGVDPVNMLVLNTMLTDILRDTYGDGHAVRETLLFDGVSDDPSIQVIRFRVKASNTVYQFDSPIKPE